MPPHCHAIDASPLLNAWPLHASPWHVVSLRCFAAAVPCLSIATQFRANARQCLAELCHCIAALCQAVAILSFALPWRFGAGHCRGRAMLGSAAARPLPCRCVAEISCATPSPCPASPSASMPQRCVSALRHCGGWPLRSAVCLHGASPSAARPRKIQPAAPEPFARTHPDGTMEGPSPPPWT